MINVAFISNNNNISLGSYRIHIRDLNKYLNDNDVHSRINPGDLSKYNIVIFQKDIPIVNYKNKKIGMITPNSSNVELLQKLDFIIVGSIEEKQSMIKYNNNIFIFPQIENMYLNINPKIHTEQKKIIIGYHGNSLHLNSCILGINDALEKLYLKRGYNIEFRIICTTLDDWITKKPKVPIKFIKWNIKTISEEIKKFDIGIIPNITEFKNGKLNNKEKLGIYNTDIILRFKNKTNIGRLLVFIQHGIPVVSDLSPSNLHILGNPKNGFAVLNGSGWYDSLHKLCKSYQLRNDISLNAYNEYKRLYNPNEWTKDLIKNIENI